MVEIPDWWRRPTVFWSAEGAHTWTVERLRSKLVTQKGFFHEEAIRLLYRDDQAVAKLTDYSQLGEAESRLESLHQQDDLETTIEMLEETNSYMWGLAIAGLFHQWERDTRKVIASFDKGLSSTKLDKADFSKLCKMLEGIGFVIKEHNVFSGMRTTCLIANTIKHGTGSSFKHLLKEKPDLFRQHGRKLRAAQPDDLRLTEREFDAAATAISGTWTACEMAVNHGGAPPP